MVWLNNEQLAERNRLGRKLEERMGPLPVTLHNCQCIIDYLADISPAFLGTLTPPGDGDHGADDRRSYANYSLSHGFEPPAAPEPEDAAKWEVAARRFVDEVSGYQHKATLHVEYALPRSAGPAEQITNELTLDDVADALQLAAPAAPADRAVAVTEGMVDAALTAFRSHGGVLLLGYPWPMREAIEAALRAAERGEGDK